MDTYSQILFHQGWLDRIRSSVKGLSYISHVRYEGKKNSNFSNRYAMKVILNGNELEFPLDGNPKFMLDSNYEDFLKELMTYK